MVAELIIERISFLQEYRQEDGDWHEGYAYALENEFNFLVNLYKELTGYEYPSPFLSSAVSDGGAVSSSGRSSAVGCGSCCPRL